MPQVGFWTRFDVSSVIVPDPLYIIFVFGEHINKRFGFITHCTDRFEPTADVIHSIVAGRSMPYEPVVKLRIGNDISSYQIDIHGK